MIDDLIKKLSKEIYSQPDKKDCETFNGSIDAGRESSFNTGKMGEFDNFMDKWCEHLKQESWLYRVGSGYVS